MVGEPVLMADTYKAKHRGRRSEADRVYELDLRERRTRLAEQREARIQQTRAQSEVRRGQREQQRTQAAAGRAAQQQRARRGKQVRTAAAVPGRALGQLGGYSGRGPLEAELIAGLALIAIRIVAEYEPSPQGPQYKGTVLPKKGQLGPLSIFAGLLLSFLLLSLLAAGGGTRAKLAVILGGTIVLTLGVKSYDDIQKVATTFGGSFQPAPATDANYTSTTDLPSQEYGTGGPPALGNIGGLIGQGATAAGQQGSAG
jgi:hypothetical protein